MPSQIDASYGLPRLLTEPEPSPGDLWAEHVARSAARAEPARVARFRLLQEVERGLAEVAR